MKAYVVITGVVFALLTAVHLWRMVEEPNLSREPWFLLVTAASAALALAAFFVARRSPRDL